MIFIFLIQISKMPYNKQLINLDRSVLTVEYSTSVFP
jgi:hypothetical protein